MPLVTSLLGDRIFPFCYSFWRMEFPIPTGLRRWVFEGAVMKPFITKDAPVTDEVLNTIAYLPTGSLSKIIDDGFFKKLTDRDFMRIAFLLARKGYEEGGS